VYGESLKDKAKQRVVGLIEERRDDIISFLGEYIRHKSVNPVLQITPEGEEECQRWLAAQLEKFGFADKIDIWEVERGRPNVVALLKGSGGGRSLLLNGHSDVVPVTEDQLRDWDGPGPWSGEVFDGKVWGRGASDMKGGNIAFIMAAKMLHDAGIQLKGDLILSLVIGEESGQHEIGCDTVLERGYNASFAVVAELTGLRLYPVLKGEIYFRIGVRGKATHICNRNKCATQPLSYGEEPMGISAIDKMWKIQRAILDLESQWTVYRQHPLIPPGGQFISINTIRGGSSLTSIPDFCEVTGSLLFNPGHTSKEIIEELRTVINSVVETDYWLKANPPEVEIPFMGLLKEPVEVPLNHEGCKALSDSYLEVMGRDIDVRVSPFVCDANFLFPKGQVVVVFGPGDLYMGVHGANEYVPVDQVINACKVFATMIVNWCGVDHM